MSPIYMFKNPEYNALKVLLIVLVVAVGGYFVYQNMSDRGTSQVGQVTPGQGGSTCISTTPPWIKVTSPNNGKESYFVGNSINLKWTSCNFDKTDYIGTSLAAYDASGKLIIDGISIWCSNNGGKPLISDGSCPTTPLKNFPLLYGGKHYKIILRGILGGTYTQIATDSSDNFFSIIERTPNPPVKNPGINIKLN